MKYFHLFFCCQEGNISSANRFVVKALKIPIKWFHLFFGRKAVDISNMTI